jgi:hypothetical protein
MDSPQILSFQMGKNTPERKDYTIKNLVVTVESESLRTATGRDAFHSVPNLG